jgi:CubicO group peptidase (beta-lactamase class C family)
MGVDTAHVSSKVLRKIDALGAAAFASLKAPGLAYGVVREGRVISKRGLGVKEIGKADPITPQTLFHMASVTKPFVATVLAQRMEQGRLRLDQPLQGVLPEFRLDDPRARGITIGQVLTHSSGLPDVVDYAWDHPEQDEAALKRYLASLSHSKLLFAPGTGFSYSNIGFEVLARVIEVLDGVPFETAVRRTLLVPLKMNRSTLFYPETDKATVATPHMIDGAGTVHASAVFPYNRPHAGSSTLLSNVDDMLRWVRFNLGEGSLDGTRILAPEAARDLRTARPIEAKGPGYPPGVKPALSWFVLPRGGREILLHPGGDLGFLSLCLFCPQDRYGLVAMTNGYSEHGTQVLLDFAFAAIDAGLLAPDAPKLTRGGT